MKTSLDTWSNYQRNLKLPLQTFQTLNPANLEGLKNSPPKYITSKILQNIRQVKPKRQNIFVVVFFTQCKWSLLYSLVLAAARRFCFTIQIDRTASGEVRAFPQTLANLHFTGMRLELASSFPPKLDWYNSSIMNSQQIVWQFYDFLIHREIWKPNCETVSWVKLWVGRSASYPLVKDIIPVDFRKEWISHDLFSIIWASTKAVKIMVCIFSL